MRFSSRRAGRVAFALAAALAASTMLAPVHAQYARITLVQADVQKRVDALVKGLTAGGGTVKYGAIAAEGKDGVIIKDVEITSPDGKTVKAEAIIARDFDWASPDQPMHTTEPRQANKRGDLRLAGLWFVLGWQHRQKQITVWLDDRGMHVVADGETIQTFTPSPIPALSFAGLHDVRNTSQARPRTGIGHIPISPESLHDDLLPSGRRQGCRA